MATVENADGPAWGSVAIDFGDGEATRGGCVRQRRDSPCLQDHRNAKSCRAPGGLSPCAGAIHDGRVGTPGVDVDRRSRRPAGGSQGLTGTWIGRSGCCWARTDSRMTTGLGISGAVRSGWLRGMASDGRPGQGARARRSAAGAWVAALRVLDGSRSAPVVLTLAGQWRRRRRPGGPESVSSYRLLITASRASTSLAPPARCDR